MPNTLAHIAVHGVITRGVVPGAEFHLIYLGCIIPDLPWILQRLALAALPTINGYDLRLYVVMQASLLMCLVLSAAVAMLWQTAGRAFLILALGCGLHLLLDPVEVKWANGVWLLFPLDWRLVQFNWLWPESWVITVSTLFGLAFFFWKLRAAAAEPLTITREPKRWLLGTALLGVYFLLPLLGLERASAADIHYAGTLRGPNRTGKYVEFDRVPYVTDARGARIETMNREWLTVRGVRWEGTGAVSLRGRFVDETTVMPVEFAIHNKQLRDWASYVGLLLTAGLWGYSGFRKLRGALAGQAQA